MMTYSPKEIFENNKLPGEIEFDICSHQEDKDEIFNFMKKGNVVLGSGSQPIDIFTPNLKRLQENQIPNIVSRNYMKNVNIDQYIPFDEGQSVYKTSVINNSSKPVIKANLISFLKSNENNRKMKTDLLSSHFSMGYDASLNPSESQSNFYKKKSDSTYNNYANKIIKVFN